MITNYKRYQKEILNYNMEEMIKFRQQVKEEIAVMQPEVDKLTLS